MSTKAKIDFPERDFEKIINNKEHRTRLINQPKKVLTETTGYVFDEKVNVEVLEQEPGTIYLLIPPKPEDPSVNQEEALKKCTQRTFDLLFTTGIGGYIVPSDDLKWVVRDMRREWVKKLGFSLADLI